ncbi:S10 family peptidase [Phenylobacterium sp.]|uniref:S10 family peptidase n=1 Tax=Phenylobacterium sp. TaxID=1871053 RepID=UPI00374D9CB6
MLRKVLLAGAAISLVANVALAQPPAGDKPMVRPGAAVSDGRKPDVAASADPSAGLLFKPEAVKSEGVVTVGGQAIAYNAVAGTIIVHPRGWDDAARRETGATPGANLGAGANPEAEASMFYVAYFKKGAPAADRPITFIYNGGPGSSTMWLHLGAFGPRRIVTADNGEHTPAAPYALVNYASSLMDVSDMVFIDAPGAGFSRIAGRDKEKAFWGVDEDAAAFTSFITAFLSQYGRWNSPKYLFGESYGTPRSAVLINNLETGESVDFNGVILLSQILNFALSVDGAENNPGSDQAYITAMPTYAATAWFRNLVPNKPATLEAYLKEVQDFALGDYAVALQKGADLDPAAKRAVAARYAKYTGLPVDYVLRADLRVTGGMYEKELQVASGMTTGRLDTRFQGPDMDPLAKEAAYDPQSAALSSAYVSGFNDYARRTLGYGEGKVFKPSVNVFRFWNNNHVPPGRGFGAPRAMLNVMPDLASAMKYNPGLKVMLLGGYYDLATPYFEGYYEMKHLPIPDALQANISYHYYQSGHMVYAHEASLKALHDDVAAFIAKNARR